MSPKRVLMIAFHFPPFAGSSGVQRTLRFVQHLPRFGWEAIVLTAHPRAYEQTGNDLLAEVPPSTTVVRAAAFDSARHLSIAGRYPAFLARPDRWISWKLDGVRQGLRLIAQERPDALWSTYPIASAHVIGATLANRSGLPWVADFRDPMAQDGYPADRATWQAFRAIEEQVFGRANACTFTAARAAATYRARYPHSAARIEVLENGYDESAFEAAERGLASREPLEAGRLTLLHSGVVFAGDRDPGALFAALGRMVARDASLSGRFRLRFRAPAHEELLRRQVAKHGVGDVVEILPPIPYHDALREMLRADGLLLLQSASWDEQVPAKLYEYLRAGRPLVALANPSGETGHLLADAGLEAIAPLEDADAIAAVLSRFIADPSCGTAAHRFRVATASRLERTRQLARILDESTCSVASRGN
jgi:glycosyltransferase involved in cell wall biosynthesis